MKRWLFLSAILSALFCSHPVKAEEPTGWEALNFLFYKPVEFSVSENQIDIISESASSLLYRQLSKGEIDKAHVSWSWMVEQSNVLPTYLNLASGDDRVVGIYLFFTKEPVVEITDTVLKSGNYIGYIWGSKHTVGGVIESANGKGRFFIIRPHETEHGKWYNEQFNFSKDFHTAFGYNGYPAFIAIAADTDDTNTRTTAFIKDITFY